MKFIRFIFSFLYVRNGYTGQWELSRPRLWSFGISIFLLLLFLVTALWLQAPVEYERTN